MKIIQEDDQRQIASATESTSRELISQLTSLNVGDAVLVGQWTNLPSLVHVEEVKEKIMGADQSAINAWANANKMKECCNRINARTSSKRFVIRLMLFSHISDTHLGLVQYGSRGTCSKMCMMHLINQ